MPKASLAVLLLVSVCLLRSAAAVEQRCQHDHTDWAEDVTAQEQAEYIDEMMGLEFEWGGLPARKVADQLPLYKYWRASMLRLVGSRVLAKALVGLKAQEAKRMMQDLDDWTDSTLQSLAVGYHCCGVVHNTGRQKAEWDAYGDLWWHGMLEEACPRNQYNMSLRGDATYDFSTSRLPRAYALAQAHAGPSRVHCGSLGKLLLQRTRHNINLAHGMNVLEDTMRRNKGKMYGANTLNVELLVKILAQASVPALRDDMYHLLVTYLNYVHYFEEEMIAEGWYETGIPDYLEFAGATPTIHHALVWVVRYSIAVLTLETFHNYTTQSADMAECRNISDWFGDQMLFSAQGLLCLCASRSQSSDITDKLADLGKLLLLDITPLADNVADKVADKVADGVADKVADKAADGVADKAYAEECHGWADCSSAFAKWGFLFVRHVGLLVAVAYLCWRPDLLIFWRARPAVRTPSYAGFVRQLKQQRFTAKAAKQAATEGLRNKPPDSKEGYAAYAAHLFWQCWCPRVRFAVASFGPLSLVSLFVAPVRLVVSGLRVGMALLGGTAKESLSGTAKALSRICY